MNVLTALPSNDPERQRLYEYEGRKYSVINLTLLPKEKNGRRATDIMPELTHALDFYKPYIWELAELTVDGVEVLGRFKYLAEARFAIRPEDICGCGKKPVRVDKRGFKHTSCAACRSRRHRQNARRNRRRRGLKANPYTTTAYRTQRKTFLEGKVCAHCQTSDELTIDHITPLAEGGALLDTSNWRVLCNVCHQRVTRDYHLKKQKEINL
ncbi:HNH endonuclease [Rhodococcus qingshengii]|uniref:HNH endonuclease n=1 Tax=Rhodococcus qingshengii TaxID=334542 RepID=UPI002943CBA4|nr:HNH endonuclease signature motif containing protein [Rhodococcus qingshengii]WOI85970.1 HNH endonuclease signature motif containing protein [Rhodococcus qingshengii]